MPKKILLTAITGGIAYLITSLAQQGQIWAVVLAAFIGGVTLVIQFLVDFDARMQILEITQRIAARTLQDALAAHTEHVQRLVQDGFSKVNEATELFNAVEAGALGTVLVTEFVRRSTQIGPTPALIYEFAQAEVARLSQFLKDLGKGGTVAYDGEDRDWLLGLTRHAGRTIDATSLTAADAGVNFDDGLWAGDLGQRYLEAQAEAVLRGVTVRRVFILDRPDDQSLRRICRTQKELGIEVRILPPRAIPEIRRTRLFDFIIFDDVVSYEVTPASRVESDSPPLVVNTHLVLNEQRVSERARLFADLWNAAVDLDG